MTNFKVYVKDEVSNKFHYVGSTTYTFNTKLTFKEKISKLIDEFRVLYNKFIGKNIFDFKFKGMVDFYTQQLNKE